MSTDATPERKIITVLEPEDEYTHEPDAASNYNESMYLNAFDLEQEIGGWFRLGNRVNEGYAEMTICTYLPGGRVGFLYDRPKIDNNDEMNAGGLKIEVIEPFEHLKVTFDGKVCLLDEPGQMANPRQAFRDNPFVDCTIDLDFKGVSPMYGGRPAYEDGSDIEYDAEKSFAKAHYEQHVAVQGAMRVGDDEVALDGLGLRDKSWGPRYWQAISWYRWLPMIFSPDFAMMLSIIGREADGLPPRTSGMVLEGDEYHQIRDCRVESEWDADHYQTRIKAWAKTDHNEYDITGEVLSLIPLRNRRATPEGEQLFTRITEAMTRYECNGQTGMGMSEYLDQVVDGRPIGPDVS
ncbi:MAG: hypothetical protein HKN26_04370 [Acidimicrobiales bacterium]|nr:hypothetical protein [Acidimicrobiales bacterium]